jgi:hypothetical protein
MMRVTSSWSRTASRPCAACRSLKSVHLSCRVALMKSGTTTQARPTRRATALAFFTPTLNGVPFGISVFQSSSAQKMSGELG